MKTTTLGHEQRSQATSIQIAEHAKREGVEWLNRFRLHTGLLLLAGTLAWFPLAAEADGLGPIFPIQAIGAQQLALRPDGTAAIADVSFFWIASHTYLHDALVSQIAFGETNQSTFQGYSPPIGGPLYSPDVAVNATNGVIVYSDLHTTVSGEGAYFAVSLFRFDTNGTPTTAISNVTEYAVSRDSSYLPVRADMNRAGRFAVVYFSETAKFQLPLFEEYIYAQLFNADGTSVAPAFVVNQRLIAYWPVVAVTPDGGAIAVWEDASVGAYSYDSGHDIYARRIDAYGNPIGNEFRVNTAIYGRHSGAEIAMATNGIFAIVWGQSSSDYDGVYLQRFNADGGRLGPELRVSPYNGTDPQVAMAADGRFIVAWQGQDDDGSGIFAQRFLADGSFYGATLWVNEGATNSQTSPLLGMADNGTFIVKWVEGTNHFARWVGWGATNQTQILGPRVQSMSPALPASETISNVTITFERPMSAASFTAGSVLVIDPLGRTVSVSSVQTADNQSFVLSFAQQRLPGTYKLTILPTVQDAFGNLLDEDGDTIKGEAGADTFRGQFVLNSSTRTSVPVAESFEGGPDALVGWRFDSSGADTSQITTNSGPHSGARHLFLVWNADGGAQSATLAISQPAKMASHCFLSFWAKYYPTFWLHVDVSADGQNWHNVLSTTPPYDSVGRGLYTQYAIDLDDALADNGIATGQGLFIRFESNAVFLDDVLVQAADPPFGLTPCRFSTLAGKAGNSGTNDGPGSAARFNCPSGPAVDSNGNVYVADAGNNTIRKVTPAGVVTTLAGLAGYSGTNDGQGGAARFLCPEGVAVDGAGNVYVADSWNHTIRRVTATGVVTTLAGLAGSYGTNDGPGSAARFNYPGGVAVDTAGNLYVADTSNHTIRKVTPAGVVTTLAGQPGIHSSRDGPGNAASFYYPCAVAVDTAGNIYVADTWNDTIRKVTATGVVTTLAGLGGDAGSAGNAGCVDGLGSAARFNQPFGVAVDSAGNVYVTDEGSGTIRKVTASGRVETVAGLAGGIGSADGTGSAARFRLPQGLAVDRAGNIYVADYYNHTIRRGFASNGGPVIMNPAPEFGFNIGRFGFDLAGPSGQVVVVDASSDLRSWLPIWTNTIGAGALYFSDPQSGANSKRFFRAVSQ